MTLIALKPDALVNRLAAHTLVTTGWTAPVRADALARLTAMGLPGRRDEYWRYTRPDALNAATPGPAMDFRADEVPVFDAVDRLRIVFIDGVYSEADSDPLDVAGIRIERLADVQAAGNHWAQGLYGQLEAKGQHPVARPFAALATATATDGVLIHATAKALRPVSLVYLHRVGTSDAVLHHVIRLDPGAELTLLENGPGAARFTTLLEVHVGAAAQFHHIRAQGRDRDRHAATHLFARVEAGALFKSFTLTVNGRLTRNEAVIDMAGDAAIAHIAGAALGDGAFHHDDTVFLTHDAVGCESRQVFKKVLRNGAVGVFQGKILVKKGAQKTDGYQISQSLLLDEDSQFLAKPELEIYADDVACSHGSTSGAIDETALYYLRSRGVPRKAAVDLLVLSFVAEALDEIADETLRDDIADRLRGWLARRA
jgi:Fe-S cluster assembly protein SufD